MKAVCLDHKWQDEYLNAFICTLLCLRYASKKFDFNFLVFVFRFGRAPWQVRMASGWCERAFEPKALPLEIVRYRDLKFQQHHLPQFYSSFFSHTLPAIIKACNKQLVKSNVYTLYKWIKSSEFVGCMEKAAIDDDEEWVCRQQSFRRSAVEGPASHYLEKRHFAFMLNMSSGSPPANKEEINMC
jgi:hypothetical protein